MNKDWVSETLPSLVSDAALFIWPGLASFHCPTRGPLVDWLLNKDWVSETLPSLVSDAALFIWPGLASFHCPTWGPSLDSRLYVGGKAEHLRLSSEKSLVFCLFYLAGYDSTAQVWVPRWTVVFMSEKRQSTLGLS